jgi:hypothetical protein
LESFLRDPKMACQTCIREKTENEKHLDLVSYMSLAKNLGERVGVQKNFYGGWGMGSKKN